MNPQTSPTRRLVEMLAGRGGGTTMETYQKTLEDQLESLVDAHGLGEVLDALSIVCCEKAAHIRDNWQDNGLARNWDRISHSIDTAARHCDAGDGTRAEVAP